MTRIEFDGWCAFPNRELEKLCQDKALPLTKRVFYALIRIVIGHNYNRSGNQGKASYTALQRTTGAARQHVINTCRQLEAEGKISITRNNGRQGNIYTLHLGNED